MSVPCPSHAACACLFSAATSLIYRRQSHCLSMSPLCRWAKTQQQSKQQSAGQARACQAREGEDLIMAKCRSHDTFLDGSSGSCVYMSEVPCGDWPLVDVHTQHKGPCARKASRALQACVRSAAHPTRTLTSERRAPYTRAHVSASQLKLETCRLRAAKRLKCAASTHGRACVSMPLGNALHYVWRRDAPSRPCGGH